MQSNTVFTEASRVMINMAKRLSQDVTLCKLLKFSVKNPLEKELDPRENIFLNNITVIPSVNFDDLKESKIVINLPEGDVNDENGDFVDLIFHVDIFTTMDQWIIEDEMIRPLKIMDEVKAQLNGKRLSSIGTLVFQNFELSVISNEVTCHRMYFGVNVNG